MLLSREAQPGRDLTCEQNANQSNPGEPTDFSESANTAEADSCDGCNSNIDGCACGMSRDGIEGY